MALGRRERLRLSSVTMGIYGNEAMEDVDEFNDAELLDEESSE